MPAFPSRLAWLLLLATAAVDAVWLAASPLSIRIAQLGEPAAIVALLLAAALIVDRVAPRFPRLHPVATRLHILFVGLAFLQLGWIALRLLNHLPMSTALPYADDLLAAWDARLPLDWHAYFRLVQEKPALARLLDESYTSLTDLSLAAFPLLVAQADPRRAGYFVETFLVTALICMIVGAFFPALAAVAIAFPDAASIPGFAEPPGTYHLDHLERLRSGAPVTLDLRDMPGLVTFPSFHTAAGILLAASFRRTLLFPPALAYALVMIAATPVFGSHYFVDLIAGAAVACLVLVVFARLPRYRGLFDAAPRHAPATA